MVEVLSPEMNRLAGRAMHDYDMLADGDRIIVAVSGGIDSIVLAWLLTIWQRKAPISYEIIAVHIDMEPGGSSGKSAGLEVQEQLARFDISLEVVPAAWHPPVMEEGTEPESSNICFQCSRSRRKQLFDFARRKQCNKIAFGHHQDDIIETFFINLFYAGNISTMVPRQDLFQGRLSIIRPLAYLSKDDISLIANNLQVVPVRSRCPLSEKTGRLDIRNILEELYGKIPEAKPHIFAALGNVRAEYLLKPMNRKDQEKGGRCED